jgi:predicted aminopeptidase
LIDENIITIQEVHGIQVSGERRMVIKLDMVNAFDKVRHKFIFLVREKFGFSTHFIEWVKKPISNPPLRALLVNQREMPFFKSSRGLIQRCPFSPPLYILMVEALRRALEGARH